MTDHDTKTSPDTLELLDTFARADWKEHLTNAFQTAVHTVLVPSASSDDRPTPTGTATIRRWLVDGGMPNVLEKLKTHLAKDGTTAERTSAVLAHAKHIATSYRRALLQLIRTKRIPAPGTMRWRPHARAGEKTHDDHKLREFVSDALNHLMSGEDEFADWAAAAGIGEDELAELRDAIDDWLTGERAAGGAAAGPNADDGVYRALLHDEPAPPAELQPLLRYLDDAFVGLNSWLIGHGDAGRIRAPERQHLTSVDIARTDDPSGAGVPTMVLTHPGGGSLGTGVTERYTSAETRDLLNDIGLHAVERVDARSGWQSWHGRPERFDEIRITLRDTKLAPYHVEAALDNNGGALPATAVLTRATDGPGEAVVPLNRHASNLIGNLTRCAHQRR